MRIVYCVGWCSGTVVVCTVCCVLYRYEWTVFEVRRGGEHCAILYPLMVLPQESILVKFLLSFQSDERNFSVEIIYNILGWGAGELGSWGLESNYLLLDYKSIAVDKGFLCVKKYGELCFLVELNGLLLSNYK